MLKINDSLIIVGKDNEVYRYTIYIYTNKSRYNFLNIFHITNMLGLDIKQALELLETKEIYISSYNGVLHFETEEKTDGFIAFLRKPNNMGKHKKGYLAIS